MGDAAVVVSRGEPGVELDRLAVILDGTVDLALEPVGDAAVVVGFRQLIALVASRLDDRGAAQDALLR